ncbi:MAG: DUF2225 domain-containing protein [Spirochaetia bacterium]|jgi:uncharacterized protein (DUF2225 family)|nr:DUF2225 domain-containing protein [Spirochaetia bacterium]
MGSSSLNSISFFSKEAIICPVCETEFHKEDIRTGRGRLIAGDLTDELRRFYEPSQKYGEVNPLLYPVTVCPECFYAAFQLEFKEIPPESISSVGDDKKKRFDRIEKLFKGLNFREERTLREGAAANYLAMMCYDFFPHEFSPVIKQGLVSYRAAWLFMDLHGKYPDENYDYLGKLFYRKASFFYNLSVEYDGNGVESLTEVVSLGPDLDKNYGYDGVLYISALLEYYYGSDSDDLKRIKSLEQARTTVARIFGMGKASKNKPEALLTKAKDLHSSIGEEIKRRTKDD